MISLVFENDLNIQLVQVISYDKKKLKYQISIVTYTECIKD